MTTRGTINSNFYQIVYVDAQGNPTQVKPEYVTPSVNANYANYAGNAFSVTGSNVVGAVNNANVANSANSVTVANVVGIGNIATSNLDGNSSNVFYGNGVFAPIVAGTNANYANYAGNAFSVDIGNVVGIGNIAVVNLDGNVSNVLFGDGSFGPGGGGNAANANYANYAGNAFSVDVGNVVGIGNIATVNLDGSTSNVLYGNGVFGPVSIGPVANANYANYAGNAFSVTGSNVVGDVSGANHANIADVANSVAGANVTGFVGNATYASTAAQATTALTAYSVAVSNVVGLGNIATSNFDGNGSNALLGNGIFGPVNANYAAYAGNVTIAAQPNIRQISGYAATPGGRGSNINIGYTSAGSSNIISLIGNVYGTSDWTTVGNIYSANANLGNVASANFFVGDGGYLSNITVAPAANANYANFAGNAFSINVSNVVGIGNIATSNFDGNSSNALLGNGVFGPVTITGTVANANYAAYAGNITIAAQPNITSTGILTSLSVSGNITVANANLGNLAIANFFSGDGGLLSNITAANVVGNLPVRFDVKNLSGGTLVKGTPIYATGSVGASGVIEVSASRADTSSTMGCIGMLEQTLAINAFGTAISVGQLTGMDTSTYVISDEIYVAPTGGFTKTRPVDGYVVQPIGTISRVNGSTGIIEVNIWDIVRLPNLDNGNIWVGTTGNGAPIQQVLSTANVGNANYAPYAGNVTIASQPNITSTGTLTTLSVSGTTALSSNLNMNTKWVTNIGYAVANTDAASKQYVDEKVSSGISYHQPVNAATTTTLATSTGGTTAYNSPNGPSNGIGAYISTTGTFTAIDGVTINGSTSIRILVKDEANAAWNGVYNYTNATAITRTTDTDEYGPDSTEQLSLNDYFFTEDGTINKGTSFIVSAPSGTITFGTSNITFSVFSTSQVYTGGTGITVSGTVISANASQTQVTAVGTLTSLSVTGNVNAGNVIASTITSNVATGTAPFTVTSTTQVNNLTVAFSNIANIANSVNGGNVSGQVANANYAAYAGNITIAAQPNITSTGILTSVSTTGNVNADNVIASTITSNVATGTAPFTVTSTTQVSNLTVAFSNVANVANSVAGGNVSGQVANALVAGTVYTNAQPNITSVGTLTSLSAIGNITGNILISSVATGNAPFVVSSTTQVSNLTVAFSNVANLANSVAGANVSGQVSNALVAGTVYTNAQPNITSTGTLASLSVTGTATVGNITSVGLGNVANVIFTKYSENVVSGGSVSGSLTPDAAVGTIYKYTLTGGITINSLGNAVAGTGMTIILTQGGSGSYTLTSTMLFLGGTKTLSTAVGAIDIMSVFYDGTTYYATLGKGFA